MNRPQTPERSPIGKTTKITRRQKQALIDNLQLEITKRARKLRAQYALQAQSLRTRVELRVNRIPTALRSERMGDLLLKYIEAEKKKQDDKEPPAAMKAAVGKSKVTRSAAARKKPAESVALTACGTKRTSTAFDQENVSNVSAPQHQVPNPSKRAKNTADQTSASSKDDASTATAKPAAFSRPAVLSPKSSNSRVTPQSPIRVGEKVAFAAPAGYSRPVSPLKPAISPSKPTSPAKAAAMAATSSLASFVGDKFKGKSDAPTAAAKPGGIASTHRVVREAKTVAPSVADTPAPTATAVVAKGRPKRGKVVKAIVDAVRSVSGSSNSSNSSTGTTLVATTKSTRAATRDLTRKAAAVKKTATTAAAARKTTTASVAKVEAPAAGRRILRKRN
ncbi:hypothetical protein MMC25_007171 [Agyrium rufum]|nr:hypothetical protein [Agyrium rufum]